LSRTANIDRRAERTRSLLAQAMIDLGATQSIDAIEVGALAEAAGVGRSTFYGHYASKQDFLTRSFVEMIKRMERAEADADPARVSLVPSQRILEHVAEAGPFAERINKSAEFPRVLAAGEAQLRALAEANLGRRFPKWSQERRRETAIYVAGGFVGLMRWWVESGLKQSPTQVQAAFERLTENALHEAQ
jgi:AcrR family transcriptional regulator